MSNKGNFRYSAVVLDLDGVITATRHLHVQAWKRAFDEYLAKLRTENKENDDRFRPFDPGVDYTNYVDGKPRDDGIRSFLTSRGITMEEGKESDTEAANTIHGLGVTKNKYYLNLLEREGPHVFNDSVEAISFWRNHDVPIAVVSSSRSCAQVLRKAGIEDFFRVRVDGIVGMEIGLKGKPNPDYFLEAVKRLGVEPLHALMVEDAVAGVEAGRRGGFGAVIGMDRSGQNAKLLLEHGADRVVSSLKELLDIGREFAA